MNLKEFVSETIVSIISGVTDAQEKAKALGAHVNPTGLTRHRTNIENNAIWDNSNNNYAQPITFDVAVTAEDTERAGAKIKVIAGIFGAGGDAEVGNKNSLASRVQFTVPVLLPGHKVENLQARVKPTSTTFGR